MTTRFTICFRNEVKRQKQTIQSTMQLKFIFYICIIIIDAFELNEKKMKQELSDKPEGKYVILFKQHSLTAVIFAF